MNLFKIPKEKITVTYLGIEDKFKPIRNKIDLEKKMKITMTKRDWQYLLDIGYSKEQISRVIKQVEKELPNVIGEYL